MIGPVLAAAFAAASVVLVGAALSRGPGARLLPGVDPAEGEVARPARPGARRAVIAVVGAFGALIGVVVAGPPGLVGGGVAAVAVPIVIERRRRTGIAHRIEEQLLDAVVSIAASSRGGRSLLQSLERAGAEIGSPLGPVLQEAAGRVALGVEVDRVLEDLATRLGNADARLVTGVLRLHRRTGGALASALDDLTMTLRARREGARELRSLTAQARLSATILGLLPLGFFLFLSVVARADVESAYRTPTGAAAIGVGLALQGAAFVWIRRLLRVEGL